MTDKLFTHQIQRLSRIYHSRALTPLTPWHNKVAELQMKCIISRHTSTKSTVLYEKDKEVKLQRTKPVQKLRRTKWANKNGTVHAVPGKQDRPGVHITIRRNQK